MIDKPQRQKAAFQLPRPASEQLRGELVSLAVSDAAQPIIERWFAQWDADPRLLVSRRVSQEIGSHGPSHQIALEKSGELDAILMDGQKRITTDSIYKRPILRTLETYPANGPMKKARLPPSAHKTKPTFGHGGKRANTPPFQPKTRPAKPVHVRERATTPSPAGETKRERGRPPGSRNNKPRIREISPALAD